MAALSRPAISHNKDDSAFSHLFYLERGTDFRTAEKCMSDHPRAQQFGSDRQRHALEIKGARTHTLCLGSALERTYAA